MVQLRGGTREHLLPNKWIPLVFRGDLNKAFKVLKAITRLNRNNAGPASDALIQMAIDEVGP